ncbi:MAG: hypothetical protein LBS21_13020 [Clostridiales bacterium]|jgi:hypothetical protein|nr:hypothetical protein [Clostridiales bacterium]
MKISLSDPSRMIVTCPQKGTFTGGSQEWYKDRWQKLSGCGPTTASNLIWYTANRVFNNRVDFGGDMSRYLDLQNEMFNFVTPGMQGVNTSKLFTSGIIRFGKNRNFNIETFVLEIPKKPFARPNANAVRKFIEEALAADSPVAFLNLSNGALFNLENWHWVTIISLYDDTLTAEIADQGEAFDINLEEWLKTSLLGGAFVSIKLDEKELQRGTPTN